VLATTTISSIISTHSVNLDHQVRQLVSLGKRSRTRSHGTEGTYGGLGKSRLGGGGDEAVDQQLKVAVVDERCCKSALQHYNVFSRLGLTLTRQGSRKRLHDCHRSLGTSRQRDAELLNLEDTLGHTAV
jgi:hypothetical protein